MNGSGTPDSPGDVKTLFATDELHQRTPEAAETYDPAGVYMIGLQRGRVIVAKAIGATSPSRQALAVVSTRIVFGDFVPILGERLPLVLADLAGDGFLPPGR